MERKILSLDSSIIYRTSLKHFDKVFSEYGIGYASSIFLTLIYESEGITMNELAKGGSFDKGTITKSIANLQENGYVDVITNSEDKRKKNLYTTKKAQDIITNIYLEKQTYWDYMLADLNDKELETYFVLNDKIIERAKELESLDSESDLRIFGFQKLTLLDYPGKMASTLFTGGCNFRCPFCQNRGLVFLDEGIAEIDQFAIINYLKERSKLLDGVCISGGEPLIYPNIKNFIKKIKDLNLKVKIDTNGSQYEVLKELIDNQLVDYVAMDIKNSKERYSETIGLVNYDISDIVKSVELLKENHVDYEFRTTIVKDFHDLKDIQKIGEWLKGAKKLYLQSFVNRETCIQKGLSAHDKETLIMMQDILKNYIENVELRGIE